MYQAGLVQASEIVLPFAGYITFGLELYLVIFLGVRPRAEALWAVSYDLGYPSSLIDAHR